VVLLHIYTEALAGNDIPETAAKNGLLVYIKYRT
jgi:hypothetical protein